MKKFSIKITLCYESSSPLDVPTHALAGKGETSSLFSFVSYVLRYLSKVTRGCCKLVEFFSSLIFVIRTPPVMICTSKSV